MSRNRELIYCDFEYNHRGIDLTRQLKLGNFHNVTTGERISIDLRTPTGFSELQHLFQRHGEAIWLSFAAMAEIECFLIAGLDVRDMRWVDLMAEAKQITSSHPKYYLERNDLLGVLRVFGITTRGNPAQKDAMRELILSTDDYSAEQWEQIVDYCWSDIEALPELWLRICEVHAEAGHAFGLRTAVFRGQYLTSLAHLEHHGVGFPVDVALCHRIFSNVKAIRRRLAEQMREKYGPIFQWNKARDEYSAHEKGLQAHLASLDFPPHWERTPSGRLKKSADYLEDFVKRYPFYKPLKATMDLIRMLRANDFRTKLQGNFIRGRNAPFYTKTSRSQPFSASGFLLSLPPWVRTSLIRPEPDHVIISYDYSREEIVIAASLSGDPNLIAAVSSGDCYLNMAKMAGAIPPEGTVKTHAATRQLFKSLQLGIGYGMGLAALAQHLFIEMKDQGHPITVGEAEDNAKRLLRWHKDTFAVFWAWSQETVRQAKATGWIATRDDWILFTERELATTVANFPMQGNGATILREAVKLLALEPTIRFLCSNHDAIYLYCHEDDAEAHRAILRKCMNEAVDTVLAWGAVPMRIELEESTYTHETGYTDKRGIETKQIILDMLDAEDALKNKLSAQQTELALQ